MSAFAIGLLLLSFLFERFEFRGSDSLSTILFALSFLIPSATILSSGLSVAKAAQSSKKTGQHRAFSRISRFPYPTLEGIWLKEALVKLSLLAVAFAWLPAITFASEEATFSSLIHAYLYFLPILLFGTICVMAFTFLNAVYCEYLPKRGKGSKRMLLIKLLILAFIGCLFPIIPIMISIFDKKSFASVPLFFLCCVLLTLNLLFQRILIRSVGRDSRCDVWS